ncbi:MAG: hypothetical protein QM493_10585 [Sulfurovum sp.]
MKEDLKKEPRIDSNRRKFLKKLYLSPVIIPLGSLIKPVNLKADGTGGPSGPPDFFRRI